MKPFLIMKTGGTFPEYADRFGDFEDWTADNMGLAAEAWHSVDVQAGAPMPDPNAFAGTVITGSHDMVTDQTGWMREAATWVRRAVDSGHPLLGICFGHQLMADALGGQAGFHPDGIEIGTPRITLTEHAASDPLFSHLPPSLDGHVIHSQTALALPRNSVLLATGSHDPHMAFRVGAHAWGVQFHPEFDVAIIRNYVHQLTDKLTEEGRDIPAILETVTDTPESASVLRRFADYCATR